MKIKRLETFILIVGLVGFVCNVTSAESMVPGSYVCNKIYSSITIDGRVDEDVWRLADAITNFYIYSPKDAEDVSLTVVRILRDEETLYVSFECNDDDVWSSSSKGDASLWIGDCVELYIKPRTNNNTYFELVVAPNGTLYDARYASRGAGGQDRFSSWSSGARVATTIQGTDGNWKDNDQGYVAEMAVPLKVFAKDGASFCDEAWCFCATRFDYSKSFEQPLLLMSFPKSLHNGFHYYEGYNKLIFK
ncbi:carbohydrate-binding family 9-like protein [Tichowtungia aerotolerans]|uniref:Carbohydrate-binding domain-containing protein n=1 Tax=Tichowtungia aerotolerans TaxID=2697043 RepID=A0A6P1M9R4_9BACT|nr:carbohydrate-binding family 9-like protein [Tichowtungia aerotolerans]QHI70667.1 hypothetical protein GT409_14875 [Tichowtungia aerotolerans]